MSEDALHSTWSASGFEQIMLCPGSKALQAGKPNRSSKYSAEGTCAHQVLTWALQDEQPASAYLDKVLEVDGFTFVVDSDMVGHVQTTIDYVNDLKGDDGVLFADIRVNYSSYLDVPVTEAWGTADVIVARGDEIIVVDLKYGAGVEVSAERNPQMSLYALGALQAYNGIAGDFSRVRMAISQPRIKSAPSEWDCSVEELEAWGRSTARSAVNSCRNAMAAEAGVGSEFESTYLRPGEKQCKFCRAKATCPALRAEVSDTVGLGGDVAFDDFEVVPVDTVTEDKALANCLTKVDMIEDWCKAVRAEAEHRLLAGESVPGFKVVQGKRGARQWADAKVAEEMFKAMHVRREDMYDMKLISPASADKLAKAGAIGPRQWPRLKELIVQSEGRPHVAPATDPRPALDIRPVADEFENIADDLA